MRLGVQECQGQGQPSPNKGQDTERAGCPGTTPRAQSSLLGSAGESGPVTAQKELERRQGVRPLSCRGADRGG